MSSPGANTALLEKLEKAELRIGLCEDSKLAKLLDPALPNIIGFLATDDAAVRAKVMAILTHLNKRIRGDSSVALPLTPLAKQFANPATAPMASNFCLVYLEMGLGRAAPAQRAVVVPPLLRGIARRGAAQQETLLSLLLGSLSELPLPGSHAELEGRLPFLTDPADRALVLEWLLDLLQFLPPPAAPAADRSAEPPPGLSADAAKRVKGRLSHEEVRGELLAAKKLAACRLLGAPAGGAPVPDASDAPSATTAAGGHATAAGSLAAGGEGPLFSPLETLPHWLVASCDGDGAVKTTGEARLRAVAAGTDLESHALIDSLCSLVLGSEAATGAAAGSAASPAARRRPSAVAVRTKAVSHLCRSVAAASRFPGVLQAAFHALFAGDATPRLQQQGAALAEHISSHAALPLLDAAGAHLLAGLLRVTRGEATPGLRPDAPEAVSMRSHAYAALAALCRRVPKLLAADSALATELDIARKNQLLLKMKVQVWRGKVWRSHGGGDLAPVLKGGAVALVDARWIVEHAEAGGIVTHRQALPKEAFLSLSSLVEATDNYGLPIAALSYPWLTPSHPDPLGANLSRVAKALKALLSDPSVPRLGVFWDFLSLHQHPNPANGIMRTEEENALFKQGLACLGTLYSHQHTTVLRLTSFPDGHKKEDQPEGTNVAKYFDRGWCYTESSLASLTKYSSKSLDLGQMRDHKEYSRRDLIGECTQGGGRRPPLLPAQFEAELETKSFTNGKDDKPLVKRLYEAAFTEQFGKATKLALSFLGWGDAEVAQMAEVIASGATPRLERLHLSGNQVSDEGCKALATALRKEGAAPRLELLDLGINNIGAEGFKALAAALSVGSAPCLKTLLVGNRPHKLIKAVCKDRGIKLPESAHKS